MENPEKNLASIENVKVEDLVKIRESLEQKILANQKAKDEDVKKQLVNREILIAEDANIVTLLEEAKKTAKYFEDQKQVGLLVDKNDIAELDNLQKVVTALEAQRENTMQKYEAIMSNPEVYGKVIDEAVKMEDKRKTEVDRQESEKMYKEMAVEFLKKMDDLAQEVVSYNKEASEFEAIIGKLYKYIDLAEKKNPELAELRREFNVNLNTEGVTPNVWAWNSNFLKPKMASANYDLVSKYSKGLKLFDFKKKSAVNSILDKKEEFMEADKKQEEFEIVQKALFAKFDEYNKEYRDLSKNEHYFNGTNFSHMEIKNPEVKEMFELFDRKSKY